MTSITRLLTTGHRLLNVLLIEARVALADGDWPDVTNLIDEFATRLQRHMHAEETVVFPSLSRLNPACEHALVQCMQEHGEIKTHIDSIRESIGRRDRDSCAQALSQLIDFLSCHCRDEERSAYGLTHALDETVLMSVARDLSGLQPEPLQPHSAPSPAVSHRLH